ncbi:MoxR family ATPase [Halobacteria archaeon HArc-gm2]|nr:MoxR family ATPase [Halobacteria archaeon HArc-gm2]
MPRDAIEDWLAILEQQASERGIPVNTDIDGRIFHFLLGQEDPVAGKVRISAASSRSYRTESGEEQMWQRFDREQERLEEDPEQRVCSIQLDIESKGEFDESRDHFLFIPGEIILQETYSKGDQKITITGDGAYEGELARFPDDWDALFAYATESLSLDDIDEERIQAKLDEMGSGNGTGTQSNSPDAEPRVWIEKTEIEGRTYKKEGELQLGNAIYSPTQDKQGHDRYAQMREADPGDIVLHLLQDKGQIVGISTIESELDTDFEGLPEFGWTDDQAGYRRWLTGYRELEEPIDIYDEVLNNRAYESRLREVREEYSNIFFDKNLALVQGGYFTRCPPELLAVISAESEELESELEEKGYPIRDLVSPGIEARDEYDSLDDAIEDIRNRLDRVPRDTAWLNDRLGEAIIADWSTALAGYKPSDQVTAETAAKYDQIREFYESAEPTLETKAEELGVGSFDDFSTAKTLFLGSFRVLQEEADVPNGFLSQPQLNSILRETYTETVQEGERATTKTRDHALVEILENSDQPIRKFTAPPEYWLTAVQYGTVSFESDTRSVWESIESGTIAFLHTRSEAATEAISDQPHGIFGVGIIGEKSMKDGRWWTDETQEDPFLYLAGFDELYLTSNLDRLNTSKRVDNMSNDELEEQMDALTANLLGFKRVQSICQETNGISFPAQGAHGVFRDNDGSPDYERPRALLNAVADRLKPTGTINAHAEFEGSIPTDPLDGLYFPGDQKDEIVQQIEAALRSGKHIILTGPPGTGKTEIARRVCSHLALEYPYLYSDFQLTTATADWSTFDTVGGYMPESTEGGSDELSFTPGVVLNRLKERRTGRQVNEPLVIDELNRADIDKAFGQLFTLLSGQSVQLPYTRDGEEIKLISAAETDRRPKPHQYVVPESWRIFATMNTYDKTSLYEMSYAFMRRFAFIRVGAPSIPDSDDEMGDLMHEYAEAWDISVAERDQAELLAIGRVWREMNGAVEDRAIGPAIVKDIVEYVAENDAIPLEDRLTRAVISYVFPQLEGVPKREQIIRQISNVRQIDAGGLGDAAAEMLQVTISDDE